MSCNHVRRGGRPATLWRRAFCRPCRTAYRADSIIALSLICRKADLGSTSGLDSTLRALNLPHAMPRPVRERISAAVTRLKRPVAVTTVGLALSGAAWGVYVDVDPKIDIPKRNLSGPNAYQALVKASDGLVQASILRKIAQGFRDQEWQRMRSAQAQTAPRPVQTTSSVGVPPASGPAPASLKPVYTLDQEAAIVAANQSALDVIPSVLSMDFAVVPNPANGYSSAENGLLSLGVLEEVATDIARKRNDPLGAVNRALDGVALGALVQRGGTFNSQANGISIELHCQSHIWNLMDELSPKDARAASKRLFGIMNNTPETAEILKAVKWELAQTMLAEMRTPDWRVGGNWNEPWYQRTIEYAVSLRYAKRAIMRRYLDDMDAQIEASSQPWTRVYATQDQMNAGMQFPGSLVPSRPDAALRGNVCKAENMLLAVSLVLHAYHKEHGSYPQNLVPLKADLPSFLHDPFAQYGDIRYRLTRTGYVLYSVGPDGEDNGGTPIDTIAKNGYPEAIQDTSTNDIVAGVNLQ